MASWAGMTAEKGGDPNADWAGTSTASVQLQSQQNGQNQLSVPSEYGMGSDAQPQIDLALAKQGFVQWLADIHAQRDMHQEVQYK